jgi:hypothetical protein
LLLNRFFGTHEICPLGSVKAGLITCSKRLCVQVYTGALGFVSYSVGRTTSVAGT